MKGEQPSPWQAWAFKVQQTIDGLQCVVAELQEEVRMLKQRVSEIEEKPSYNIESIEYHFDQLKVEQLDGTLNIGMSAPTAGDIAKQKSSPIEQLSLPKKGQFSQNNPLPKAQNSAPIQDSLLNKMKAYLNDDGLSTLLELERKYNIPLDTHHRSILLEDISKQLPGRIRYYHDVFTSQAQPRLTADQLEAEILDRSKHDSIKALEAYFDRLQTKE